MQSRQRPPRPVSRSSNYVPPAFFGSEHLRDRRSQGKRIIRSIPDHTQFPDLAIELMIYRNVDFCIERPSLGTPLSLPFHTLPGAIPNPASRSENEFNLIPIKFPGYIYRGI